jgi:hypothetical protein
MEILQDAHRRTQRVHQLAKRPKRTVALRPRVGQGGGLVRETAAELWQQGSEGPDQRAQRTSGHIPRDSAERLDDRPQGERVTDLMAASQEQTSVTWVLLKELAHQPGLTDPCLAHQSDQRGRVADSVTKDGQLCLPANEHRRRRAPLQRNLVLSAYAHAFSSHRDGSAPLGPSLPRLTEAPGESGRPPESQEATPDPLSK